MSMVVNWRYRIVYQPAEGQKPRTFVADYIGETEDEYLFSGRPAFGTLKLRKSQLISLDLTDDPIKSPRIYRAPKEQRDTRRQALSELTPDELERLVDLMRMEHEEPKEVEDYLREQTPAERRRLYIAYTTAKRSLRRPL